MVDQPKPSLAGNRARRDADHEVGIFRKNARIVARGDEAAQSAAVLHVDAERLRFAGDDIRAVVGGRREHAERNRIDPDHEERAVACARSAISCRLVIDDAEEDGISM